MLQFQGLMECNEQGWNVSGQRAHPAHGTNWEENTSQCSALYFLSCFIFSVMLSNMQDLQYAKGIVVFPGNYRNTHKNHIFMF